MRQGNLQIVPSDNSVELRMLRQVNTRPRLPANEDDDSLIFAVLQRRWKLLTFCTILSLIAAVYAYIYFSLPKSVTEAALMYRSLPPSSGREINDPFQPLTVADIMLSNEILLELASRHKLSITPKKLRKKFEVDASRYNNILNIKFDWHDGKQAIAIVNELMRLCIDNVVMSRKEYLSQYRKDEERALEELEAKIEDKEKDVNQIRKQIADQLQQAGRTDSRQAILINEISGFKQKLDDAHAERNGLTSQIDTVRSEIAGIERQLKAEALKGKQAQLAHRKRIAKDGTPRMRLLEQSIENFDTENAELEYMAWKAKLDSLGKELLAYYENPSAASTAILESQMVTKHKVLDDLELKISPLKDKIDLLISKLDAAQIELNQFVDTDSVVSTQLEEAELSLEDLRDQRGEFLRQRNHFVRLETSDFEELKVQTPASWDTTEVFNGKKKLFVLVFAGCLLCLTLPVFAIEHFYPSGDAAELSSRKTGLPLLARGTFVAERLRHDKVNVQPLNSESLRLLALRIQQSVQGPGAIVLFSGLNHESNSIPTMSYLAECLARREERVLIIDAVDRFATSGSKSLPAPEPSSLASRNGEFRAIEAAGEIRNGKAGRKGNLVEQSREASTTDALPLGLSDYFRRHDLTASDLICGTDIPGVDMIPAGSEAFPGEVFSSARVTSLLDDCRQDYTLILVSGPSTSHPSDLQMLAARADGILLTVPESGTASGSGDEVVRDLLNLGAPVIGIVG
jgi:Mrp family chromosome partitioning ATPase